MALFAALQQQLDQAPTPPGGVYTLLCSRADPAAYMPQAATGVEEQPQREDGHEFVVLRSPQGAYLRLTPAEHAAWQQMDGTHTVGQLAFQGYQQHGKLLLLGDLVGELRRGGFLHDRPTNLYQQLAAALADERVESWGERLLRLLREQKFPLRGIDGFFDSLYRWGGWLCFTPPALAVGMLLSLLGLVAFGLAALDGQRTLELQVQGSLVLGGLALLAMVALAVLCHECAHGLAVKHYRRRVRSGGLMLFFGLPAAYVDTSDIWAEPPLRRIAVSAAGPASDLLLGGVGALIAYAWPASPLAPFGWRLALACYGATLFNLNPLLELDGYYMLVDFLRLPGLRQRAFSYIRGPLWERLRSGEPPAGDERVLAAYGLLATGYLVVAGLLALLFWERQLLALLAPLWNDERVGGRLVVVLVSIVFVAPLLLGLLLALWSAVQSGAVALLRRGYGRRTGLLASLMLALTLLLALLPFRFGGSSLPALLVAVLLWATACWALWELRTLYRGAALAPSIDVQLLATLLALCAASGRLLAAPEMLPIGLDWLAIAALFAATLAALPSGGFERAPRYEQAIAAALIVCAFPIGAMTMLLVQVDLPGVAPLRLILRSTPVFLGIVVLALALPVVLSLRDSRVFWGRVLLWFAAAGQTVSYLLDIMPGIDETLARSADIAAAGIWCAAWGVHLLALRQLSFDGLVVPQASAVDERGRLLAAFSTCYSGLYHALLAVYGRRRAQVLDDRMDIAAATANWQVTMDREHAEPTEAVLRLDLAAQGARYGQVLRFALRVVAELAGEPFARRAMQASYDSLPWPEREAADRFVFPSAPWAHDLAHHFHSQRDARMHLLRSLDLLIALDDADLEAINAALVEQPLRAGEQLLRAGQQAAGLWVVDLGEVAGWQGSQISSEYGRGSVIGEWVLHDTQHSPLTFRANIDTTLLFLPHDALSPELRARLSSRSLAGLETLRFLERVPLFADAPRHKLRELAAIARQQAFAPWQLIVQQGKPSGVLYIIRHGEALVLARRPDEAPLRARLGPLEVFGELEFLRRQPPMASVVAKTPLDVLVVPHTALDGLLSGEGGFAQGLERVGSGRLLSLRGR